MIEPLNRIRRAVSQDDRGIALAGDTRPLVAVVVNAIDGQVVERNSCASSNRDLHRIIIHIECTCQNFAIKPRLINSALEALGTTPLQFGCKLSDLVNRPQLNLKNLSEVIPSLKEALDRPSNRKEEIAEAAEIRMKYKGYIERERLVADKMHRLENIRIKGRFNYEELQGLSTECRQKLQKIQPETLAQASRIPGVSPSDINVLLVLMGR